MYCTVPYRMYWACKALPFLPYLFEVTLNCFVQSASENQREQRRWAVFGSSRWEGNVGISPPPHRAFRNQD